MDFAKFLEEDEIFTQTVVIKQYLGNHCEKREVVTGTPTVLQKKFLHIATEMAAQKKERIPLKVTMTGRDGRYLEFKNWRDDE